MNSKFIKRICSLAMVVFMVLSMMPTNVFATSAATPAVTSLDPDGNGCPHCEGEIEWITFDKATHLDANRTFKAGGHYKLGANLTLKAATSYQAGSTTDGGNQSHTDVLQNEACVLTFEGGNLSLDLLEASCQVDAVVRVADGHIQFGQKILILLDDRGHFLEHLQQLLSRNHGAVSSCVL